MTEIDNAPQIKEIAEKMGKSVEEVQELIHAKIQKFSGLLTEQGAVYMLQKEVGMKQEALEQVEIGKLQEGMKGVEVKGIVGAVFPLKEFEKNGKKGKLKSFVLSDGTGEVRVTLWNDQVDKYDITTGSEICLNNILASKYNDKMQVTLGFNGVATILNKKEESFTTLSELKAGMGSVNVVGRIMRKFPCKDFETSDRKGKVCSFQFGDETALLRASAWNDKASELAGYNEGDAVEIKNAYTKEGKFGVELHLGYTAHLTTTQKKVPDLMEILKESVVEKKLNSLMDNENVIISGKITNIVPGNFNYLICEKCGKKLSKSDLGGLICEACGEVKGKKNPVVSATVEDDTGRIQVTFFGKNALDIFGWSEEEFNKELEEKSVDRLLAELNGKLNDKPVKVYGYQRANSFSGTSEFMAKEVMRQ
ncbi:MAG: hypothetical protein AABW59_00165 [archaeon]